MAVPQTASLAITAASTVHKTVLIAADERAADDMLSDKLLTFQAQALLLTEPHTDLEATCYNGDIYLVGEFATPTDRDRIIARLQEIDGVRSVKGVIKQQSPDLLATVKPTVTDSHAETVIEAGLFKELHIRSANVDVEVVQGEAVVIGVVRDKEEGDRIIDIVKRLRPKSDRKVTVTSLLAYQDAYESGRTQANETYALMTQKQVLASVDTGSKTPIQAKPAEQSGDIEENPALENLYARYFPHTPSAWQKARRKMKTRILNLAKAEHNPQARKELITLSSRVLKDKFVSIERRLIKTLKSTQNPSVRNHVDRILDEIAPERTKRIQTLAMN